MMCFMLRTTYIWCDRIQCHTNMAHNTVPLNHIALPKVVLAMPKVHAKIMCYFYMNTLSWQVKPHKATKKLFCQLKGIWWAFSIWTRLSQTKKSPTNLRLNLLLRLLHGSFKGTAKRKCISINTKYFTEKTKPQKQGTNTCLIIFIIWSIWSETRGSTDGGKHWRLSMSDRKSSENLLLKLKGSSPSWFALAIIYRIPEVQLRFPVQISKLHLNIHSSLPCKIA